MVIIYYWGFKKSTSQHQVSYLLTHYSNVHRTKATHLQRIWLFWSTAWEDVMEQESQREKCQQWNMILPHIKSWAESGKTGQQQPPPSTDTHTTSLNHAQALGQKHVLLITGTWFSFSRLMSTSKQKALPHHKLCSFIPLEGLAPNPTPHIHTHRMWHWGTVFYFIKIKGIQWFPVLWGSCHN